MSMEPWWNDIDKGKPCNRATNLTWADLESSPDFRGSRPATNRLFHGTAYTKEHHRNISIHHKNLNIFMLTPTIENTPEVTHTMSDRFTEPVFCNTPVGDTKIPEPIMLPTMTVIPFNRLIFALRQISSSPDDTVFCPPPSLSGTTEYFCFSGILSAQNDTQTLTITPPCRTTRLKLHDRPVSAAQTNCSNKTLPLSIPAAHHPLRFGALNVIVLSIPSRCQCAHSSIVRPVTSWPSRDFVTNATVINTLT